MMWGWSYLRLEYAVFSINLKSFENHCDWSILISAEESNRSTWLWSVWRTQLTEFRRMPQYLFLPHEAVCYHAVQIHSRIIIIIIYFRPSNPSGPRSPAHSTTCLLCLWAHWEARAGYISLLLQKSQWPTSDL